MRANRDPHDEELIPREESAPDVLPSLALNHKIAIAVLTLLLLSAVAGSFIFGLYAWHYRNDRDLMSDELAETKAIIKEVICNNTIDNEVSVKPVKRVVKTADEGFLVSNGNVMAKTSTFADVSWKYAPAGNETLSEVVVQGVSTNIFVVLNGNTTETLVKLNSSGSLSWSNKMPENYNWTVEVVDDTTGGCLVHGLTYYTNYQSYFLKYNSTGNLDWNVTVPMFVANSVSLTDSLYYLVGEQYVNSTGTRFMAIFTLDANGALVSLANNTNYAAGHGAFWNGTELMVWYDGAESVSIASFTAAGAFLRSSEYKEFTRIHQCIAGLYNAVICTFSGKQSGAIRSIGTDLQWKWSVAVPNMIPKVLDVGVQGYYLAIFSENSDNYNERHQRCIEVDGYGRVFINMNYKTKTAELYNALPHGKSDLYAIVAGPTFFQETIDAPTRALIFPKKLSLNDLNTYCNN